MWSNIDNRRNRKKQNKKQARIGRGRPVSKSLKNNKEVRTNKKKRIQNIGEVKVNE